MTSLEAGVRFETATEGGRRMTRGGKKRWTRLDIARRRGRRTRLGKLTSQRSNVGAQDGSRPI